MAAYDADLIGNAPPLFRAVTVEGFLGSSFVLMVLVLVLVSCCFQCRFMFMSSRIAALEERLDEMQGVSCEHVGKRKRR